MSMHHHIKTFYRHKIRNARSSEAKAAWMARRNEAFGYSPFSGF